MQKLNSNYQVHFFSDNQEIKAEPSVIGKILGALGELGLVPTFGKEFNVNSGESRQVLKMVSNDEKFQVSFYGSEIVITCDTFEGEPQSFVDKVVDVFNKLASIYPDKKANRISIVHNKLIHSSDPRDYTNVANKLFVGGAEDAFEWDCRLVRRQMILNETESINANTTIRRGNYMQVNLNRTEDVIGIEVDTNTIAERSEKRFLISETSQVLNELLVANSNLLTNVEDRVL